LSNVRSRVLVVNPGSTSTKLGVFNRVAGEAVAEWGCCLHHTDEELACFRGLPALAQSESRAALIAASLAAAGYSLEDFAAFGGRGGLLPPTSCGTYLVDEEMVEILSQARRGEHASNLGAVLALHFAQAAGVSAYIVDPVTVDEWQPCARLSGSPFVPRVAIGHALNTKAVARRFARDHSRTYEQLRLIILHLGSGITVSAHANGRMIDNNSPEEGPFGPDRSGALPVRALIRHSLSGEYNAEELDRQVFGEGGIFAYLGTRDLQEVERRMESGDNEAREVFEAMAYQIAKEAGALAAALEGRVDAILFTGGMAHSKKLVPQLRSYLEWIAPIHLYPGEDELQALAEGVFRVLYGEEQARRINEPDQTTGKS